MIFSCFSVLRKLYVAFQFLEVTKKVFILFSHYWTWELLIFFASLTLWPLSYCSLTYESACVPLKLFCIISIVMRGEIVVCLSHVKLNELHPIICKKKISSTKFSRQYTIHRLILWNYLKKIGKRRCCRQNLGAEILIWIF